METTTATPERPPDAPERDRPWTRHEVEEQEAKARELTEKVEELRADEERLTRRIAAAHADGADADAIAQLTAARREAVELRGDLENALPVLRERIAARRETALKHEAERRMVALGRAHGSARASYDGDLARIDKAADAFRKAVERLNERYATMQRLETEAIALRNRWPDLDPPAIERVVRPAAQEPAVTALNRARAIRLADPGPVPRAI